MQQVQLTDKRILVGVSGSIAIYKACELVRLFVKSGADVHVVMSPSAERFISPLTFEALTRNKVLTTESESWSSDLNHIDQAKKADAFVIAPATANTINKLSKGIADTLLLQCALAYSKELIVAPSANTQMLQNHYTEGSLKMLNVNDVAIVSPQSKLLACGDEGNGALAEPSDIYYRTLLSIYRDPFWENRKVVVTGGGTREKIDEVRYISNYSSGKMAKALALAIYLKGADVCYISTMPHEDLPSEIYTIDVESAQEMFDYTVDAVRVAKKGKMSRASMNSSEGIHLIQKTPFLFMAAAVADYRPAYPQDSKLKKSTIGEKWMLELSQTKDILKNINKTGIYTVAFKAEMDSENGLENAQKLLVEKEVDAVCYNLLKNRNSFGSDSNAVRFISKEEEIEIPETDKFSLASEIIDISKKLEPK